MIDQLRQSAVRFQLIPLEGMVAMADWRALAACAGMDPESFFTEDIGIPVPVEVLAACGSCPVRAECLAAMTPADWVEGGVRGGLTQSQRRLMPRPGQRREPVSA